MTNLKDVISIIKQSTHGKFTTETGIDYLDANQEIFKDPSNLIGQNFNKDKNTVDVNIVTHEDDFVAIEPNSENLKAADKPLLNNAISTFGKSNSTCYNAAPVAVASRTTNPKDVLSIIKQSTHVKCTTEMEKDFDHSQSTFKDPFNLIGPNFKKDKDIVDVNIVT